MPPPAAALPSRVQIINHMKLRHPHVVELKEVGAGQRGGWHRLHCRGLSCSPSWLLGHGIPRPSLWPGLHASVWPALLCRCSSPTLTW